MLAVPFVVAIVTGPLTAPERTVRVWTTIDRSRLLEGEEALVEVRLETSAAATIDVTLDLPPEVAIVGRSIQRARLRGQPIAVCFRVRCLRWGVYEVARVRVRSRDLLWLNRWEGSLDEISAIRVYPRPEALRRIIRPTETQVFVGNQVARLRGGGIEFAEIRPFVPGDRVRHINWPATGRRGELQVNDHHTERNSDVILFLDTFATNGDSVDRTLRAAIGMADLYLAQRDRVGVITFGGTIRWLRPGMGIRQRYVLVEAILDTRVDVSYAWKAIDLIPPQTLPPKALVIALTPMIDERILAALDQLSGRGFDLAICEVAATPPVKPNDQVGQLAARILALRRKTRRQRYHEAGVATTAWRSGEPLEQALEEVRLFRRYVRRRSA